VKRLIALFVITLILSSCDVLKQVEQMGMLAKCDFRIKTVENTKLAGVNIQHIQKLTDLNLTDAARISAAMTGKELPLTFTLNVEARNPNTTAASMQRIDWILLIDDIEMANGTNSQQVMIPANQGTVLIPLQISADLNKVLTGKSGTAILNFGFNLAGAGNVPSRITLKAKPTILIGSFPLAYPGYITVNQEFSSN
jgi:LEA14-like dessication related protein